ncbi:MAG: RHS repeat-associated core domain-containing protein [Prochloron sp. SP5CPC1]|nr:RHS repeat-associated core domain-containing protein [Candidatus Paraprochloron terpiosi SP5CPC1]
MQWGLGDNLGTIRLVVNSAGEVVNRIVYDSFGEVVSESNPGVDFRYGFTGRELEPETGLLYYRARYHDEGRFISEDPIGFGGGDGNLYRYVGNGQTIFTDPSGLQEFGNPSDDFRKIPWLIIGGRSEIIRGLTDQFNPDGSRQLPFVRTR